MRRTNFNNGQRALDADTPYIEGAQNEAIEERANPDKNKIRVQAGGRRLPAKPAPASESSPARSVESTYADTSIGSAPRPPQGGRGAPPTPSNRVWEPGTARTNPSSIPKNSDPVSETVSNIPENIDPLSKIPGNNGRPLSARGGYKYDKYRYPAIAEELVGKLGARNKDLAEYFDVSVKTIEYWLKNKPEFAEAVRGGRVRASIKVAQSLYNKAVGLEIEETVVMQNIVKEYYENGKPKRVYNDPITVVVKKTLPPDTYAAVKFLNTQAREIWSEAHNINVQHEHTININKVEELNLESLSEEMREMLFQVNLKQLSGPQTN